MQVTDSIPDILQRLRSSRKTAQVQAAAALFRQTDRDEEARLAAVAAGAIPPLIRLLRGSSTALQQAAASALSALARSDGPRAAIAAEGGVQALVPLLVSRGGAAAQQAAAALVHLAIDDAVAAQVAQAAGALPALVQLCSSANPTTVEAATGTLCNVAKSPSCAAGLVASGTIEALACVLTRLLCDPRAGTGSGGGSTSSSSSRGGGGGSSSSGGGGADYETAERINAALRAAVFALGNLAERGPSEQAAIAATTAPAALVHLASCTTDEAAQLAAAGAIENLICGGQSAACAAVADAGGIEFAAAQLASSRASAGVRDSVLRMLFHLSQTSAERRGAITAAGCIPRLVRLLGGSAGETAQECAAATLSILTRPAGAEPDASPAPAQQPCAQVAAAGGVPALCVLLSRGASSAALRSAAEIAENLARSGRMGAAEAQVLLAVLQPLCGSGSADVRGSALSAVDTLLPLVNPIPVSQQHALPAAQGQQRGLQQQRQPHPPRTCAAPGCGATAGLRRCGGCGAVCYCSEACCRAHWRAHKAECRRLQAEQAAGAQV